MEYLREDRLSERKKNCEPFHLTVSKSVVDSKRGEHGVAMTVPRIYATLPATDRLKITSILLELTNPLTDTRPCFIGSRQFGSQICYLLYEFSVQRVGIVA